VADVMKQYGYLRCLILFFSYVNSFACQTVKGTCHQVHGTYRMMETGVQGTGINKVCKAELPYPSQSLENGVFNDVKDQITLDVDKSVDRVIKNFLFIQSIGTIIALGLR